MIAELAQFSLILALTTAIVQTLFPAWGTQTGNITWISLARPMARLQFIFISFSFLLLTYCFIVNDFSVAYVANNSNSSLPLVYRISAVWASHEGSLLLWVLILSGWTVALTLFSHALPLPFVARVISVMGSVSIGFLLFVLFASNPFNRLFPVPADGADLNPLLQDLGLIIHPPMLYMGYVGFAVTFGFAMAALSAGTSDTGWSRWLRPWAIMAWMFLTVGIALGSWWAYYELGWGGWWFWDPVENASFMPWLAGTALIHSLAVTEKRGVFKNWTILLAISAFALSLLGTFLVRSGVLTSVHAFAIDPGRGIFILSLLSVYIGGSLLIYAWRAPLTRNKISFGFVSRETFLLLNSILMLVIMLTVLLGTVYPLIVEALGQGKLSVGAPYFNAVFIPLMIPVILLMGIGTAVRWKQDKAKRLWQQLYYPLVTSLLIGTGFGLMFYENKAIKTTLGIIAALWIIVTALVALYKRLGHSKNKLSALKTVSRSFYGMTLAHIGFAISLVGITITSLHDLELHERMAPGNSVELAGYNFELKDIHPVSGPNYQANEAIIKVTRNNSLITVLRTQKRIYTVRNMPTTEAGIDPGFIRDLYVSLGEPLHDQSGDNGSEDNTIWSIRLYHKPLVRWIWLGAMLMAAGGLLAATDQRYRIGKIKRAMGKPRISTLITR